MTRVRSLGRPIRHRDRARVGRLIYSYDTGVRAWLRPVRVVLFKRRKCPCLRIGKPGSKRTFPPPRTVVLREQDLVKVY